MRTKKDNRSLPAPQNSAARQTGGKKLATQQSVDQMVKAICDIMRRGNCKLLEVIEAKGREITAALAVLRKGRAR